jgi:hypothetical protein
MIPANWGFTCRKIALLYGISLSSLIFKPSDFLNLSGQHFHWHAFTALSSGHQTVP